MTCPSRALFQRSKHFRALLAPAHVHATPSALPGGVFACHSGRVWGGGAQIPRRSRTANAAAVPCYVGMCLTADAVAGLSLWWGHRWGCMATLVPAGKVKRFRISTGEPRAQLRWGSTDDMLQPPLPLPPFFSSPPRSTSQGVACRPSSYAEVTGLGCNIHVKCCHMRTKAVHPVPLPLCPLCARSYMNQRKPLLLPFSEIFSLPLDLTRSLSKQWDGNPRSRPRTLCRLLCLQVRPARTNYYLLKNPPKRKIVIPIFPLIRKICLLIFLGFLSN